MLSNSARTCTAKSYGYCTLSSVDFESLLELERLNPSTLTHIRNKMLSYVDEDMELRRRFVMNIPLFRSVMDEDIISEVVLLMSLETY